MARRNAWNWCGGIRVRTPSVAASGSTGDSTSNGATSHPDGELLVYFASKFSGRTLADPDYTYAWTAVSRPPWLTALALWPKGDCWHGGGHVLGKRRLLLNHRPEHATPHPRHRPHGLRVEPNPDAHGENEPMYARRLDREGWTVRQPWDVEWLTETFTFRTKAPEIRARPHRQLPYVIRMERRLDGFRYRELYTLEGPAGRVALPLEGADAVNWEQRGRLAVLRDGSVHVAEVTSDRVGELRTLIDLLGDQPEPRSAPAAAQAW